MQFQGTESEISFKW